MSRPPGELRFLLTYALAYAGAVVAYAPLLTLLLPVRVAALAGADQVAWLSLATLLGAVSASVSNVVWGWASDLRGSRRAWVAAGSAATIASYGTIAAAASPAQLVAATVVFQASVNLLLAPLVAWAADRVPDHAKGLLGGLLGAGPAVGALAGVLATLPELSGDAGLAVVAALIAALTLPLLAIGGAGAARSSAPPAATPRVARRDFALLWLARLFVQVAAAVLFAFLLFYFQALPDRRAVDWVARLNALALALGFPLALLIGRASDRLGPRRPFLIGAAAAMAMGLAVMSRAPSSLFAAAGYLLFGGGMAVFLPLHAAFAMQLLPRRDRHGRDLGVLNLANTLPQIAATLLTVGLVPRYGYGALLATLAAGALIAAGCVFLVRCDRQAA